MIPHKKMLVRLLLIILGFFGTPALYRASGAADYFSQLERPGVCIFWMSSPKSYDTCLQEHLGGKPYWDLTSRKEYKNHRVLGSYVYRNGVRWQVDIVPWDGLEMQARASSEVFALKISLIYPKWWSRSHISNVEFRGDFSPLPDLTQVGNEGGYESYAPFTPALVKRMEEGLTFQLDAYQGGNLISIQLPSIPKSSLKSFLEPQYLADKITRKIDDGEIPKSVYGNYSLNRKGDEFILVTNTDAKPIARWQLKTAQRTIKYSDGAEYVGIVHSGKYHGQGRYTWANGDAYQGNWVKGQRTGLGRYSWKNGDFYNGEWVNGQRHGSGLFSSFQGWSYEGEYRNNKEHGRGVKHWPSGNRYEGDFVDGQRTGEGVFTWAKGSEYRGEFVKGKRHGHGFYRSSEGWTFEGEWRNSKRHGYGEFTSSSGRSSYREYYHGERIREPEVAKQKPTRKKCGSYENPCEIPTETGLDAFAKSLARAADNAFGSNQYGSNTDRAAQIQAENEARWRANDRILKREMYEAKVAAEQRNKKRAAERAEHNRHHGTCDEKLELDGSKKAWYYIWSSKVCGRWDCDNRSNQEVETRLFLSNLVYARKFDHENLNGGFFDQVRIQYKQKSHNPTGIESNGYVCRGDARNARRSFIADRSDNDRTYIFDVDLPEYP